MRKFITIETVLISQRPTWFVYATAAEFRLGGITDIVSRRPELIALPLGLSCICANGERDLQQ